MNEARSPGARNAIARARAVAAFYAEVSPRLFADLEASGALAGVPGDGVRDEWHAVALHSVIRGIVAEGEVSDEKADLVDALHDIVLAALEASAGAPALRAHLARRYGEYDGVTRTLGRDGAARVPAGIAAACAKHMLAGQAGASGRGTPPALAALADTLAPLLEALAEGAMAALAEPGGAAPAAAPGLRLPPLEPLLALTARLDSAGIAWAVGGSALLASLGLVSEVNDWDVQVDADPEPMRLLFADLPHGFHGHGGCHADWKLTFAAARTELIPRFAFFVPGGVVRVPLAVSGHWRGLPIASLEGWACAYWLMGEYDEPGQRTRRSERAEWLFAHIERAGADPARRAAMLAEPLPAPLAARLRALRPA